MGVTDTDHLRCASVSLSKQMLMLQRHCSPLKHWKLLTEEHSITSQKTCAFSSIAVRTLHTAIFCTLLCLVQTNTILNSYPYLKVILFTHSPMLERFVVKGRLQTSFCLAVCLPYLLAAFLSLDHLFLCCCILFVSPSYAACVCIVLQWFISLHSVFCASTNICSWILADFWTLWRYSGHILCYTQVHHSWQSCTHTPDRTYVWPSWNCYLPRIGKLSAVAVISWKREPRIVTITVRPISCNQKLYLVTWMWLVFCHPGLKSINKMVRHNVRNMQGSAVGDFIPCSCSWPRRQKL